MKKEFKGLLFAEILSHVGIAFWAPAAQAADDFVSSYTCTTQWDDSLLSFSLELTPSPLGAPFASHQVKVIDQLGNHYAGTGYVEIIKEETRLKGFNRYTISVSSPDQTKIGLHLVGGHPDVFGAGSIFRSGANEGSEILVDCKHLD